MAEQPLTDWESGLFDCFEDPQTCCYGCWCAPCLACTVSRQFGENYCLPLCDLCYTSTLLFFGMPLIIPPVAVSMRASMRKQYGIKGSICKDILASCCCVWCSWCQMYRELKHHKKVPVIINMESQTVVNMQPAPVMMVPAHPPAVSVVQTECIQVKQ